MVGFIIGVFLAGSNLIVAYENHSNGESHHEEESHVNTLHKDPATTGNKESYEEEMDHSKMTKEEHQKSIEHEDTDGSISHEQRNSHSEDGAVHEEAESVHGHGGANLIEKPANMKVLGTFGAINLSFILIGIWNKWFTRKEEE
jgi:hypothetical protein